MKLFKLKYLDPEEMAKNLDNIFGALDFSARGAKPSGINFVPIPRLNSLLVVSASPKTMEDVERWVGHLPDDPPVPGAIREGEGRRRRPRKALPETDRIHRGRSADGVQAGGV